MDMTNKKLSSTNNSNRFSLGKDKHKRTGYSCMQQRGYSNGFLSGGVFTIKGFLIQILIGIVGGIGVWYFTPAIDAIRIGDSIEPLKIIAFLISIFFVMGGLFGLYDLIRELLGF